MLGANLNESLGSASHGTGQRLLLSKGRTQSLVEGKGDHQDLSLQLGFINQNTQSPLSYFLCSGQEVIVMWRPTWLAFLVTLVALFPVSSSSERGSVPQCPLGQAGSKQVENYVPRIPVSYEEFCAFPANDKKKIFGLLSPELKSKFAGLHFTLYLSEHSSLNQEQRNVIEDAIRTFSPAFFSEPENSLRWSENLSSPLKELEDRIQNCFSAEESKGINFFGPKNLPVSKDIVEPEDLLCTCASPQYDCGCSYSCCYGFGICLPTWGCGMTGFAICTKLCPPV